MFSKKMPPTCPPRRGATLVLVVVLWDYLSGLGREKVAVTKLLLVFYLHFLPSFTAGEEVRARSIQGDHLYILNAIF